MRRTIPRFVEAVKATKRSHLIIAGLWFEVCASSPTISAKEAGYNPIVALDACGTFSQDKRQAGIARLCTLGIEVSDYATCGPDRRKRFRPAFGSLRIPSTRKFEATSRKRSFQRRVRFHTLTIGVLHEPQNLNYSTLLVRTDDTRQAQVWIQEQNGLGGEMWTGES